MTGNAPNRLNRYAAHSSMDTTTIALSSVESIQGTNMKHKVMLIAFIVAVIVAVGGLVAMVIHDRTCPKSAFVQDQCAR